MATIRTVKVHDPKNPRNIIQVNDPVIVSPLVVGHDTGPNFDPKIHVKLRAQGERYTAEEEALLAKHQRAYEERQAERRKSEPESSPDSRDLLIERYERELAELRAANAKKEASEPASEKASSTSKASAEKPAKKPAAQKDEPVEDVSLVGLAGVPETKK